MLKLVRDYENTKRMHSIVKESKKYAIEIHAAVSATGMAVTHGSLGTRKLRVLGHERR